MTRISYRSSLRQWIIDSGAVQMDQFSCLKGQHSVYILSNTIMLTEKEGSAMIWKDMYRIGVPQIDAQHEELFSRVTAFVETLRSDREWAEKVDSVNETLDFMKEYVITHFRDEEAYQEEIGYPQLPHHKKIHDDMVGYVGEVSAKYTENGFKEIQMQQFAGKLVTWLVNHVVSEDQKVAEYAKNREGR